MFVSTIAANAVAATATAAAVAATFIIAAVFAADGFAVTAGAKGFVVVAIIAIWSVDLPFATASAGIFAPFTYTATISVATSLSGLFLALHFD